MNHSTGPFTTVARQFGAVHVLDAQGLTVAHVCMPVYTGDGLEPADLQDANACLLAAAPDLLAACRNAIDLLDGVAAEEEHNGKRNAAMNVRAVENALALAVDRATRGCIDGSFGHQVNSSTCETATFVGNELRNRPVNEAARQLRPGGAA